MSTNNSADVQLYAGVKEYVRKSNEILASLQSASARWWNYSISHRTFEIVIGDHQGKENIAICLNACKYIGGPVKWENQQLRVQWIYEYLNPSKKWIFELQDEVVGFKAVAGTFSWKYNFDIYRHGSIYFDSKTESEK